MGDEKTTPAVNPQWAVFLAAVESGNLDKVRQLVAQDRSLLNARTPEGQTAVQLAAEKVSWDRPKCFQIAHFLVESGAPCDIFAAARAGLLELLTKFLAENPALLNAKDGLGRTPLQRAALVQGSCRECEAVADYLLERGAGVDIFTACTLSQTDAVKRWLAEDRRLVHARCQGGTPLLWAVRPRHTSAGAMEIAALLLDNRADVNAEDSVERGMTVLHHAVARGNPPELVAFLIDRGADVNLKDDNGWTPLDHANEHSHRELAALLRSRGAKETGARAGSKFAVRAREMIAAAQTGDVQVIAALLAADSGLVHARGACGETPLHWAAHNGFRVAAELLLKHGAEVNAEATLKWGGTPLAWAAERQLDLIALLLARGADVGTVNSFTGQTPLHCCARAGDNAEVAAFLVAHGAAVQVRDNSGKTALAWAFELGHGAVADVLRKSGRKEG